MAFARATVAAPLPSRPRVLAAPLPARPRVLAAAPMLSRPLVLAAAPMLSRPLVLAGAPMLSRPLVLAAALRSERAHRLGVGAGRGGAPGRDLKAACAKDGVDPPSTGDEDAPGRDAKDGVDPPSSMGDPGRDAKDGVDPPSSMGDPGRDAKDGVDPPSSMGDKDEFFEKMYKHLSEKLEDFLGLYMPLPNPHPVSEEEKAVQEKLKEIAEKCIALNYDAMRRLPQAQRRRLNNVFLASHNAFAVVRSRATDGRASMGMAVVIAQKLYVVVEMVSAGCSSPLPLDLMEAKRTIIPFTAPVFPLYHGVEVLVFNMIENLYNDVKRDIDAMISGAGGVRCDYD